MTSTTMKMPDLGEGVVEAELVAWLVSEGDAVTTQTPIAEVQTDKASVEISAPANGVVTAILAEAGGIVTVGSEILTIELAPGAALDPEPAPATVEPAPTSPAVEPEPRAEPAPSPSPQPPADERSAGVGPRPIAAPAVRRVAKERGVDLQAVAGSGPGGRILHEDLEVHDAGPGAPVPARRPDAVEQLRGVRRTISQRLTTSWATPHITLVDEVDVTELEALRAVLGGELADAEVRVTPLTFIARAVALACGDHPRCNATFDPQTETLTTHGAVHLGVATQTDRGLMVPVVRDADRLSLTGTAREIRAAADAARGGTASREQLGGSTITISSLGALGGLMNTPILNAPEVAIVGVNKMRTEPVWDGSAFVPRQVVHLSASFDHRVVDGWDAAVFVQRIKELLETPALLTLGWAR